jgi:heat shock protein HtpX
VALSDDGATPATGPSRAALSMWEAIQSNRRRSRLFLAALAAVLVGLGTAIGLAVDPRLGGPVGALAALGLYGVLLAAAFGQGEGIVLAGAGARPIDKSMAPQLWNVVEEMTVAASLPAMPKLYLLDLDAPNAFAVGTSPEKACLVVTTGLVKRMNRDELQGVIAHEIGHVRNLDTRFMTLVTVMAGAIVLLSDGYLRIFRYGPMPRRSSRDRSAAPFLLLAVVAALLAPIAAQLLSLACSRRREYLADATAVRLTRFPLGLASALEKIAGEASTMKAVNRAVAPLFIVNPLEATGLSGLFSTHPPTQERVQILRRMGGMAGYADYDAAYRALNAGRSCLDPSLLGPGESLPARPPSSAAAGEEESIARAREVAHALGGLAGLLTLTCACGVGIQVPPNLGRSAVVCPRCGRENPVPTEEKAAASEATGRTDPDPAGPLRFRRTMDGWESFRCRCGKTLQIGPAFAGTVLRCPGCRRSIRVEPQVRP